jgi:hypothetical protein
VVEPGEGSEVPGELVKRPGALAKGAGKDVAFARGAQSTARVTFDGELVTWKQLPAKTRRAVRRSSPIVAEAVQLDHRHRVEGGRAFEYATGWRAYEDAIVLAEVARPVAPAPEGGSRPVGPWEHRSARAWEAAGPPRRRRGVVDVADELGPGERGSGGLLAIVASGHGPAASAWSYLPQAVRIAGERLVPEPVVWFGEIVQNRSADRFPLGQDVRSLRLSADRAVVIVATRSLSPIPGAGIAYHVAQMARVPWLVEQIGFDLGDVSGRALLNRA